MPDPTGADRQRRWRDRQAGRLPSVDRPSCAACGRVHTGIRGVLCSRCWRALTPEGKADRVERVRRAQARRKGDRS